MTTRSRASIPALATCLLLGACASTKGDSKPMSQDEMMEKWTEYATPGEPHRKLDPMAGTFRAAIKHRMDADAEWMQDSGTCRNTWTMGNRFLESNFTGTMMGMPFEGRAITGYDNANEKYTGFWYSNFETGLMPPSVGTVDASGRVFTFLRECKDPLTGEWCKSREIVTIKSANEHGMEFHMQQGDAPEFHMMTIAYTRM